MKKAPIEITRARLEARIEALVALLGLVDGDENAQRRHHRPYSPG